MFPPLAIILYIMAIFTGDNIDSADLFNIRKAEASHNREVIAKSLLQNLETIITAEDNTPCAIAIGKLGIMRSTEAIPFLVRNIDFSPTFAMRGKRAYALSEARPCVYSLGLIGGKQCHDAVLSCAASTDKDSTHMYVGIVLIISLGYDDSVALVNARADREKDEAAAMRLRKVAKWIDDGDRSITYVQK